MPKKLGILKEKSESVFNTRHFFETQCFLNAHTPRFLCLQGKKTARIVFEICLSLDLIFVYMHVVEYFCISLKAYCIYFSLNLLPQPSKYYINGCSFCLRYVYLMSTSLYRNIVKLFGQQST